jgi:fusion and transport protein UGO1
MSSSTRDHNPLRPYYKPPSIGLQHDTLPAATPASSSKAGATHGLGVKNGSAARYASSARDMFNDLDYAEYLSDNSPSGLESVHRQVNDWTSRYFGVLLAQPFDVAKTILQVRHQGVLDGAVRPETGKSTSRPSFRDEAHNQVYHISSCQRTHAYHVTVP